jgi:uncharacterized membrane protein YphA (DoxX/SURF4 family)
MSAYHTNQTMKKINLLDIIVFLFVTLFLYASCSKLIEYDLFQAQIGKSPLIMGYSKWLAFIVPLIEIVTSIMLLIPRLQTFALYLSFSIMFLFSSYIAFILTLSPYVPCSCGGILSKLGWTEHLIFNIVFTAIAIIGIHLSLIKQKPETAAISL